MTTKKLIPSENQEQRALVKWLSYHPIVRDYFLRIKNEGKKTPEQGWNDKLLGLRPGVSDLFIYYPTKSHHGLFLEVKRNKSYTKSERSTSTWIEQELFQKIVKKVGFDAKTCYGWEEGKRIIEGYLLT
jgi:hypothetical protein